MKRYVFSRSSPIPKMATHPKGNWCHWNDVTKVIRLANELQHKLDKYEARERADNETLHEFADHLAAKRAALEGE